MQFSIGNSKDIQSHKITIDADIQMSNQNTGETDAADVNARENMCKLTLLVFLVLLLEF